MNENTMTSTDKVNLRLSRMTAGLEQIDKLLADMPVVDRARFYEATCQFAKSLSSLRCMHFAAEICMQEAADAILDVCGQLETLSSDDIDSGSPAAENLRGAYEELGGWIR